MVSQGMRAFSSCGHVASLGNVNLRLGINPEVGEAGSGGLRISVQNTRQMVGPAVMAKHGSENCKSFLLRVPVFRHARLGIDLSCFW